MTQTFSPVRQVLLAVVLIAVPVAAFSGYELYTTNTAQAASTGLGDLSSFKTIVADVQALVDKGDMAGAQKRITDYETAWDQAETAIRPLNQTEWGNIDMANDGAFSAIRKSNPDRAAVKAALATVMATLDDPTKAP
jgi:Tfp pilus assembly protein PilV